VRTKKTIEVKKPVKSVVKKDVPVEVIDDISIEDNSGSPLFIRLSNDVHAMEMPEGLIIKSMVGMVYVPDVKLDGLVIRKR